MRVKAAQLLADHPIIDVRSPSEFAKGHIPGAYNIPLFTDQQRHEVGLCYKEQGQKTAITLGLQHVGKKLSDFIDQAQDIALDRVLNVYCWRGGMRSAAMSWLFESTGIQTKTLEGGYKAWRQFALETIRKPRHFISLTGYTGVGKTEILMALAALGEQVIDLEGLANHQGSAFVATERAQPSSEHFENLLALELLKMNTSEAIWIEDESRSIGKVFMDVQLYNLVVSAPVVLVTRPDEQRVKYLCEMYGEGSILTLINGFERIKKRLGYQHAKAAQEYLNQGNLAAAARIAIQYYDKAYMNSMSKSKRVPLHMINLSNKTYIEAATELKEWKTTLPTKNQD